LLNNQGADIVQPTQALNNIVGPRLPKALIDINETSVII